jgi:predicted nucleic acid-binding protein
MTAKIAVLDTSVFVEHLRTGRYAEIIEGYSGLIRTSSVVLAELWRGAASKEEYAFLRELERTFPVWTPTERNWLESGQILGRIRRAEGLVPSKLRDLHFDVLIALTARSYGARVITSNAADFELIKQHRSFELEVWR